MVGAGVLTQSREGQRITYAVSEEALDAAAKLLIAD
jgi:DNA-binding transcriptional regulator PaaX